MTVSTLSKVTAGFLSLFMVQCIFTPDFLMKTNFPECELDQYHYFIMRCFGILGTGLCESSWAVKSLRMLCRRRSSWLLSFASSFAIDPLCLIIGLSFSLSPHLLLPPLAQATFGPRSIQKNTLPSRLSSSWRLDWPARSMPSSTFQWNFLITTCLSLALAP